VSILLLQEDLVQAPLSLFKPLAAAPAALSADAFAALLPLRVAGFVIAVMGCKSFAMRLWRCVRRKKKQRRRRANGK